MSKLEYWCKLGVGRQSKLAEKIGVSRQAINQKLDKELDKETLDAIAELELLEMFSAKDSGNITLKCAKYSVSKDKDLADFASKELARWSKVYGSLVNENAEDLKISTRRDDFIFRRNKTLSLLSLIGKNEQILMLKSMQFNTYKVYQIRKGVVAPNWEEIDTLLEKLKIMFPAIYSDSFKAA